jgi:hypothetical protein
MNKALRGLVFGNTDRIVFEGKDSIREIAAEILTVMLELQGSRSNKSGGGAAHKRAKSPAKFRKTAR